MDEPTKQQRLDILLDAVTTGAVESGNYILLRTETYSVPLGNDIRFHLLGGIIQFRFVESDGFRFRIESIEEGGLRIDTEYRKEDAALSPGYGTPEFIEFMTEPTLALTFSGILSEKVASLNLCFWGLSDEVIIDESEEAASE